MRRPNLAPYYRWLVMLTAGLILLQALFAGRFLSGSIDFNNYHGILANLLFLAVVVQMGLTVAIGIPGDLGKRLLWLNGALLLLTVAQIGLGYSARTGMEARAWHIPLGVLIFGLAVVIAGMVPRLEERGAQR